MLLLVVKSHDNVTQCAQTAVNTLCLSQPLALRTRLLQALAAGQVHQVQLAARGAPRPRLAPGERHLADRVAARTPLIALSLTHRSVSPRPVEKWAHLSRRSHFHFKKFLSIVLTGFRSFFFNFSLKK